MRTVRRLLYGDMASAVAFVTVAFLSLFFFIDVVDELQGVGQRGYAIRHVLLISALELPSHFYELFPITVLIGCIFSLSRLAQTSQFTILRTAGLGPARALALLASFGAACALLTYVVGDFLAPMAEREAAVLKVQFQGGRDLGAGGAWLKESRVTEDGPRNASINVRRVATNGELEGISIYEFGPSSLLKRRITAERAQVGDDQAWMLRDVEVTQWPSDPAQPQVQVTRVESLRWPSSLSASVTAAAVQPLSTMSTLSLWRYVRHLSGQEQASQLHAIQFWRRALYPLACLVMVALALPFAYLHGRAGGVSFKVFGGIMLGISFVLLNNVAGHIGLLRNWTPWIAAATPGAIYLLLSLAAFTWLVRYR